MLNFELENDLPSFITSGPGTLKVPMLYRMIRSHLDWPVPQVNF